MKTILSLFIYFSLFLPAQGEEKASKELLRDGLFEEEVNQDFAKAEAAYRSVTKRYDKERYFAGLAFFRLAEIARKSDKQEEALALYRRVVQEFPDQKEIAKRAAEQLGQEAPKINRMASGDPLVVPLGNAETAELQRLEKIKRDSPDLLNGVGEDGWHPLHKAAAHGWTNVVDYLLAQQVSVDPRTSTKTEYRNNGFTPLHLAVIHGHLTIVDRLLTAKADLGLFVSIKPADLPLPVQSTSIPVDSRGDWNPLHLSILYQRRGITPLLLKSKSPPSSSGPYLGTYTTSSVNSNGSRRTTTWKFGATPLMLAVWLNDRVAIQTLIDGGADINESASEERETPLLAAIWESPDLVPFLIKNGAKVTDEFIFGKTLLHWAVSRCKPPVILQLVENGADVNLRVKKSDNSYARNTTPLELAMGWNLEPEERHEVCLALLKAGALPSTRVLTSATAYDQLDTMKALIEAKVDLNGGNDEGNRPLHYSKSAQGAKLLLEAGAQLEIKNHEGITPFGMAVNLDDTPKTRALIDYLLAHGADTSMLSYFLFSKDETFGDRPLLPYVMSKTKLAGESDPKAIKIAFPKNWTVITGENQILPGTPPPSLRELLCLNYQSLGDHRNIPARNSTSRTTSSRTSRNSSPPVVTDLVIYRPNEKGDLVEVAQLADQRDARNIDPKLQWGDIVLLRLGSTSSDHVQMPLVHYVSGVPPITITLKVGPWENKVRMENTHQTAPGLDLQDHFNDRTPAVDLSKLTLRRANGESTVIDFTSPREPKKIRLMDGDTIEYSLKPQVHHKEADPVSSNSTIHLFFPDRPVRTQSEGRGKEVPLADLFHGYSLLEGRDLSKAIIQRMGEEKLEKIPLDLTAASQNLTDEESSIAKATELLKSTIYPGDILIFPPKENLSWSQLNNFVAPYQHPELSPLVKLVQPTPQPRAKVAYPKPKTTPSRVRRVPTPPSR